MGFSSQIRKKAFPNFFLEYYQRKKLCNLKSRCACKRHYYDMPILLCFSDVFLHCKNVSISHVWEVNNGTAWLKPQWNSLKLHKDALKKNYRNPGDTRRCFNVIRCLCDVRLFRTSYYEFYLFMQYHKLDKFNEAKILRKARYSEAYSKPSRTSKMQLFMKILNSW